MIYISSFCVVVPAPLPQLTITISPHYSRHNATCAQYFYSHTQQGSIYIWAHIISKGICNVAIVGEITQDSNELFSVWGRGAGKGL